MKRFLLSMCLALAAGLVALPAQADAVWNETVIWEYDCRTRWLTATYLFDGGPSTRVRGQVTWTEGGSLIWEGNVRSGNSASFRLSPGEGSVTITYLEGSGSGPFSHEVDANACPTAVHSAKALFKMYLLTGGGKFCVLISETPPSIERQKQLCFPGEDWVAEQVPCAGPIYDDDVWVCDSFGYPRLGLEGLKKIYERHAQRSP
jgi:hypothetical protein